MNTVLRCLVLLCTLASTAFAFQCPPGARDRWERMSAAERETFVERFEKFRALPPEQREKLVERAKRLEGLRGELVRELPPEVRAKLERLSPAEHADALREFVERRLEGRGRHVRGFLPRELREQIEKAPPEAREPMVREFCDRARRDHGRHMLESLAQRLALPDDELARIEALSEPQRFDAIMELRRKVIVLDVRDEGPPSWLDAAEWAELEKLPTREFFERFHDLRRDRCGSDHDGGPGGSRFGPPSRHGDFGRGHFDELFAPDPAWRDDAEKLPESERRGWLEAKLRERVLERLADRPDLVTPEQLAELRKKQGRDFQDALRAALRRRGDSSGPAPRRRESETGELR